MGLGWRCAFVGPGSVQLGHALVGMLQQDPRARRCRALAEKTLIGRAIRMKQLSIEGYQAVAEDTLLCTLADVWPQHEALDLSEHERLHGGVCLGREAECVK